MSAFWGSVISTLPQVCDSSSFDTFEVLGTFEPNTFATLSNESGRTPDEICEEKDLWIKEDSGAIEAVIDKLIADNPKPVEQYRNGEQKVFGFFMGQANKALKGQATPAAIKEMLERKLKG